jgi:hypothetical protein
MSRPSLQPVSKPSLQPFIKPKMNQNMQKV